MTDVDLVGASFEVDADALGLGPPPVPVRARLEREGDALWLAIQPEAPGPHGALVDWLAPHAPRRVELGDAGALRAEFRARPAWFDLFEGVELEALRLAPGGSALVEVRGPRPMVQRFAARAARLDGAFGVNGVRAAVERRRLLTEPQEEALRAAVAAGYYRIPRPLNLHELADQMGITAASLSERLRRAEGRVLTRFVEADEGRLDF